LDYRNIRINLAACRVNAEKTQKEWAEMIGVSPSTVNNWEAKKSSPDAIQLRKISGFSGIPMDFIFVSDEYD
jgi:transcriptional regulator with XRE-family HTH domain